MAKKKKKKKPVLVSLTAPSFLLPLATTTASSLLHFIHIQQHPALLLHLMINQRTECSKHTHTQGKKCSKKKKKKLLITTWYLMHTYERVQNRQKSREMLDREGRRLFSLGSSRRGEKEEEEEEMVLVKSQHAQVRSGENLELCSED